MKPKPMIEIGGKPIIWHSMKIYSAHGINVFWANLPLHLLLNIASIGYLVLTGRAGVIQRAKRDSLHGLGRMLECRKAIRAAREASALELRRAMKTGLMALFLRT